MIAFIRARWGFIAGLMALTLLYGCFYNSPFRTETYAWHQRIQAEVSTPQGPVQGAVVQAVRFTYYPNGMFAAGTETDSKLTGEALVVDLGEALGPRRYLFALLSTPNAAFGAFDHLFQGRMKKGAKLRLITEQISQAPQPYDSLRWVGFADVNDPKTVFAVDPTNLSTSYGEGYALTSVTFQITDSPSTDGGVEKALSWWCDYTQPRKRLSGETGPISDNQLANRLGPGDFKTGTCK